MKSKYDFLTKEFLHDEHWNKQKTLTQIAEENDIAGGSMRFLMDKYGVEIRSKKEMS